MNITSESIVAIISGMSGLFAAYYAYKSYRSRQETEKKEAIADLKSVQTEIEKSLWDRVSEEISNLRSELANETKLRKALETALENETVSRRERDRRITALEKTVIKLEEMLSVKDGIITELRSANEKIQTELNALKKGTIL